MGAAIPDRGDILQRMVNAVELVHQRLLRAAGALRAAGIDYAVAAWVATVDEAAVRNTRDVHILIRRADLPPARAALEEAGFVYRRASEIDLFLDGPKGNPRHSVRIA